MKLFLIARSRFRFSALFSKLVLAKIDLSIKFLISKIFLIIICFDNFIKNFNNFVRNSIKNFTTNILSKTIIYYLRFENNLSRTKIIVWKAESFEIRSFLRKRSRVILNIIFSKSFLIPISYNNIFNIEAIETMQVKITFQKQLTFKLLIHKVSYIFSYNKHILYIQIKKFLHKFVKITIIDNWIF